MPSYFRLPNHLLEDKWDRYSRVMLLYVMHEKSGPLLKIKKNDNEKRKIRKLNEEKKSKKRQNRRGRKKGENEE